MYRLLIADDEDLEREGLEWIVKRMMPDRFEVIHAENGRIAIERAEELRPHIVFMDVNMPGIQGLAALREIKVRLPEAKLVLVTAYDYFAYAKEALSLGVKEYIVKPASREQVVEVLTQLTQELDQEKRKRTEELALRHQVAELMPLAENELALMLMVDHVQQVGTAELSEWIHFPLEQTCAVVVAFPERLGSQEGKKLYDSIRSFAKSMTSPCIISSLIERHMTIFLREPFPLSVQLHRQRTIRFAESLSDQASKLAGLTVSIGIGSLQDGAEGLRQSYYEAVFASTCRTEGTAVCHFEELKEGGGAVSPEEGDALSPSPGDPTGAYVLSALKRIREEREQQTHSVLDRAKQYMQERFTEELSLEEVADYVHLNPHYFSKVFKQQVGETFIDYLTGLRIEKAKALIAEDQLSLKEVCFAAGYRDPNYFSRVFKKVTGVTPTEYRSGLKPRSGD
ncbi:AraC family transcriptional regulator [Paenibacillus harenae]|uniref:Two-component system response regulator YesN n=1 Tax=Paenibacillus harenae TaxID=306543 RepID=A0ABT9U192_PAEHA|nr:AraC family transcriptional regulator [Paenibacillus harenae]MDQ0060279.1 two-component system response regulator YesN [Paenibacillus harenae]MDQ0112184.1 two-component system response regulator YesN [Paenibacillus harenae]